MAFPTTGVLDTFDRANSGSLGANWNETLVGSWSIASNLAAPDSVAGGAAFAFWSAAAFTDDVEAYAIVSTKPPDGSSGYIFARLQQTGSLATLDGYDVHVVAASGTDTFEIQRLDNAVSTVLTSGSQELTNGNGVGIEIIGTTLRALINTGSGYTQVLSTTSSTYTGSGNIGIGSTSTTTRLNDFGGGVVNTEITGAAAITLGALTAVSAGTVDITGNAAPTLGAVTTSAAGTAAISGAAAVTLATLTSAASGTNEVVGSAALTLEALTSAAA